MPEHERLAPGEEGPSDEQAIVDMLIPWGQSRIDAQLRDSDALDPAIDRNNRRVPDKNRLLKAGLRS
jgi:hypothetical protein